MKEKILTATISAFMLISPMSMEAAPVSASPSENPFYNSTKLQIKVIAPWRNIFE